MLNHTANPNESRQADTPLLQQLIEALRCLPGVGHKTAQRMAFQLLERNRQGALNLAGRLREAVEKIGHCQQCRTLTEKPLCRICSSTSRSREMLCVVESPTDVMAIEYGTDYRGVYYVLMGRLSPLDGIGPAELGLEKLEKRLDDGQIKEVILATNSTVEGEVTAHVIAEMARKRDIKTTRLAQGVPVGGELEYMDSSTLSHAFSGRRDYT
ncbi:MAG: recombination mediator RecR [Pseudomonadota bacterium]|nr:recombination mediator RecR [Pseudomonadota bacterium]